MNWKSFLVGIAFGAILTLIAVNFIGNRYKVSSSGPSGVMTVKLDTWTGKTWMARFYEHDGAKIWYWDELQNR